MATGKRTVDLIDKLSFPLFALSIAAEYVALRHKEKRTLGDLVDADEERLSGTTLPADLLVPLGFERSDTKASLAMLSGNVAVQLALAPYLGRVDAFLFRHRVSNIGNRRGSLASAIVVSQTE